MWGPLIYTYFSSLFLVESLSQANVIAALGRGWMSERAYVCDREKVWDSPPPHCQQSPLPSSSLPSHHLSPWADRGLISQLSTHFLRLSPSRSHTLLLLLPSVPFSISLPPSIILGSPSLTFMPSISFIALLHFTSSLSGFLSVLLFLCVTLTIPCSSFFSGSISVFHSFLLPPALLQKLSSLFSSPPLSHFDVQKYTMPLPNPHCLFLPSLFPCF